MKYVAKETGVHHSQISRFEHGEIVRLSANVQKICDFLQVTSEPPQLSDLSEVTQKVQTLVQRWPQSELLIRGILDSMLAVYEAQQHGIKAECLS